MYIDLQQGLGDAIYAQPVIKALVEVNGTPLHLKTTHRAIFEHLGNIQFYDEFTAEEKQLALKLHWFLGRRQTAFEQLCLTAQVAAPFKFDLPKIVTANVYAIVEGLELMKKAAGKGEVCLVKLPYIPVYSNTINKKYESFAGDIEELKRFIVTNKDHYLFVTVGTDDTRYSCSVDEIEGIDVDLNGELNLHEFLYLCRYADAYVSQLGHMVAMACAFRKKIKIIMSNKDNPSMYQKRFFASVIENTCELI